ncbi:MAG: zinc metalloprotease HtpX [Actinomycetes bacterium]|jgi:heat shock protein HtpX|nr:zinc metalloprotease HtpX [Candidatus Nanopelagicales bacterium]MDP4824358.1 zinc metalloprotease HtpX [Candidatus Nanopelagicales bacterium]MDP4889031.1 zinc metalloprotease HtpX [Candidatus Nanopelagicales bacterium]
MARTRFGTDRGLTARMVGTLFGLGLMYVILGGLLLALGFNGFLVLGLIGGLFFAQWWFSDSLALSSMRAHEVTLEQAPQLHAMVDRLCALADMEKPRIAIADSDVPNAFATGRTTKRSVVVVTTGLLRRLDQEELEGVLAHELSHVAHRDVLVMTIASFTAILAGFMVRSAMWGSMMRDRRDNNTALIFFAVMAVSILVYAISWLLIRALSRYREMGADRGAAYMTGKPSALASALQKISGEMASIPNADLRRMESVSAFAFAPAFSKRSNGFGLESLMSTHPSLEKRLAQLAKISTDLGGR